jgi:hypothetical protein
VVHFKSTTFNNKYILSRVVAIVFPSPGIKSRHGLVKSARIICTVKRISLEHAIVHAFRI